jgi:hypothetical protein
MREALRRRTLAFTPTFSREREKGNGTLSRRNGALACQRKQVKSVLV